MQRRRALTRLSAVALSALALGAGLGACGFQLRQPPRLPFDSLYLRGFETRSPMRAALERAVLNARPGTMVDRPEGAQVILQSLLDRREKVVVASGSAGQVREYQIRVRLRYQVLSADGRILLPPTELVQSREFSYREDAALAKIDEEAELMSSMQADIVQQVMRQLAALHGI